MPDQAQAPAAAPLPPKVDASDERTSESRAYRTTCYLLLAVGVTIRILEYLHNRSLWLDEAMLAVNIVDRSAAQLFQTLDYNQGAPVGFLLLEKLLTHAFGISEHTLRLIPLLGGIAAIFLVYAIGKRILTPAAGLIALASFAIAMPLVSYSADVKQYSSDCAVGALLLLVSLWTAEAPQQRKRLVVFGVCGAATVWFSHPACFVLAGAGLTLISQTLAQRRRRVAIALAGCAGLWLVSFAALYFVSLTNLERNPGLLNFWHRGFMPFPPRSWAALDWYPTAFFSMFRDTIGFAGELCGFLFAIGAASMWARKRFVASVLLLPLLIALIASSLHRYPFQGRMLLFAAPGIVLLLGEGMDRIFSYAGIKVVLLVIMFLQPTTASLREAIHPSDAQEFRSILQYAEAHRQPGDVLRVNWFGRHQLHYYDKLLGLNLSKVVIGPPPQGGGAILEADLERLRGERVWLLFTLTGQQIDGLPEEVYTSRYLDRLGSQIDSYSATGASVHLYDLRGR